MKHPAAKNVISGLTDHLRMTNARCKYNNSKMQAPSHVELVHETTGVTGFTDESNTCASSEAGVILQDRYNPANLEQSSDAGTYYGVFSYREL